MGSKRGEWKRGMKTYQLHCSTSDLSSQLLFRTANSILLHGSHGLFRDLRLELLQFSMYALELLFVPFGLSSESDMEGQAYASFLPISMQEESGTDG
jgi:hypothetical protein